MAEVIHGYKNQGTDLPTVRAHLASAARWQARPVPEAEMPKPLLGSPTKGRGQEMTGQLWSDWRIAQGRAHTAVHEAIKTGKLTDLNAIEVPCVDCGSRAMIYDHRDYEQPLTVEPVCFCCNIRRGSNAIGLRDKPVCPNCGSKQVLYRISKGYICRVCGHEWRKE